MRVPPLGGWANYQLASGRGSPRFQASGPARRWVRLIPAEVGSPYPGANTNVPIRRSRGTAPGKGRVRHSGHAALPLQDTPLLRQAKFHCFLRHTGSSSRLHHCQISHLGAVPIDFSGFCSHLGPLHSGIRSKARYRLHAPARV